MNEQRARAEGYLRAAAETFRQKYRHLQLHYAGPADFVLQHGTWFDRAVILPGGTPGKCFGTSIVFAARFGEQYWEGFGIQPMNRGVEALIPHAWTTHELQPTVVRDRTWPVPGSLYVGVPFSAERADDCTWNGDACVLWDDKRGFPIFREPWRGEPPGLVWPPSERIDLARHGTPAKLRVWQQANPEATAPGHLTSDEHLVLPPRRGERP